MVVATDRGRCDQVSDPRSDDIDIERALSEFLQTVIEWDAAENDAAKANKLFDRLHRLYKQLRNSEACRAGIASLMNDLATLEAIEHYPGLEVAAPTDNDRAGEAQGVQEDWQRVHCGQARSAWRRPLRRSSSASTAERSPTRSTAAGWCC
jgi:hypothetical protein